MTGDRDCTPQLRQLMQAADLASFAALQQRAGVSTWPVRQLRRGRAERLRAEVLLQLARSLQISLLQLLAAFGTGGIAAAAANRPGWQPPDRPVSPPQTEPAANLEARFQRQSLEILEPFLLQWPTAVAAVAKNPQIPAQNLLLLAKPVEQLLANWGLEPIGSVGAEAAYDPQLHELMQGQAEVGTPVRIRYVGYRHGDRLLHRARVSPV